MVAYGLMLLSVIAILCGFWLAFDDQLMRFVQQKRKLRRLQCIRDMQQMGKLPSGYPDEYLERLVFGNVVIVE
jgi:hypothetical protein